MMRDEPSHAAGWLPVALLSPSVALSVAARLQPAIFESLRRDPGALARGELWRLLTPVLVQADILQPGGLWRSVAVFLLVGALLAVGTRAFGARRVLILYGLGALVGHGIGQLWQPYSSGCSVAGCGVLGGLAIWLLRARAPGVKLGATLVLALALAAVWLRDIHGPPLLAGAAAGLWLLRSLPLPGKLGGAP